MKTFVFVIQLISSILLIGAILLQAKGTGLGSAWGGEGNIYRSKRGAEKVLFTATIIISCLFLVTTLANTLLNLK